MKTNRTPFVLARAIGLALLASSSLPATFAQSKPVYPFSDPNNSGGWVLNQAVSDEFEGTKIDESKWFVEGQNGDFYIWKGRAPSQFAPTMSSSRTAS